jgi:GntR family transcriptional repressor for pyruvate dehydrogenase complex
MKIIRSSDVVVKKLLELVMKGEIAPGDKLPSTENLAKTMGTSVISAREAVKNLEVIGIVEISHGRGIFLTRGAPVFEELLEARKVIESHSAVAAAQNRNGEALAQIRHLLSEMDRLRAEGDIEAYSEMDYEFHLAIGKAAQNRILFKMLENIRELLRYQQSTLNRIPDIMRTSSVRHREIFEAITKGDSERAGAMMRTHLGEVIDSWKRFIGPQGGLKTDSKHFKDQGGRYA